MSNLISKETLINVCKAGQGIECCRYILAGTNGIECGKHTDFKKLIDNNINNMVAKGDNCEGLK